MKPAGHLLERTRAELSADFDFSRPIRFSRAPGCLDVMGGIAQYTGAMVCQLPLDRAAEVALQERNDRQLQIFSFNLLDENKPFTFRIPIDALAIQTAATLCRDFNESGRRWAGYVAGCLFILHEQGFIHLRNPAQKGLNLAILSTVPMGVGLGSSAAITIATMMNLRDHFQLMKAAAGRSLRIANSSAMNPIRLAEMCQAVENRVVGSPCGIASPMTSCRGESEMLLRMVCQPHELQPPLKVPDGVRFIGINSTARHDGGGVARTRCAAFMAHKIILEKMRQIGASAGRRLTRDPMNGYLANLDPDDYKRIFRTALPEKLKGSMFVNTFGGMIDTAGEVELDMEYAPQAAADHHVLEARRIRNFAALLEEAAAHADPAKRGFALDRAGHLMYASHHAYTHDAMLGAAECDLLVQGVRKRERAGLYGARITGNGSGGTVAVLADATERADAALADIMEEYEKEFSNKPEILAGSGEGAWQTGTSLLEKPV